MTEVIEKTEYKKGYKKTKLGWIPENWDILKFKEMYNFLSTGSNSRNELNSTGEYLYIHYGDIHCKYKNILNCSKIEIPHINKDKVRNLPELKDKDLIFVDASEDYEGITKCTEIKNVNNRKIISGLHTLLLRPKKDISPGYGGYIASNPIVNKNIKKMANGWKVYGISKDNLSKIFFVLPGKKEQEKIVEILSAWDDGIETLEKLIEQKEISHKALMKNLLIGKIRLFGYNSKWTHSKFNSIFERITRKNEELNSNILTISAQNGLISQKDFYNKRIASVDTSKYILLKNGEFAYNKSYSNGYPLGAIKRLDLYEKGVVSSLYICFKLNNSDNCSDFWKYYFEAGMLNREIKMIAQEGARNHGLLNMATEDFFNMLIYHPKDSKEQQKIAEILNKSDKEIQILNSKLEKLKEQKKGLMQKLLTGQIRVKI